MSSPLSLDFSEDSDDVFKKGPGHNGEIVINNQILRFETSLFNNAIFEAEDLAADKFPLFFNKQTKSKTEKNLKNWKKISTKTLDGAFVKIPEFECETDEDKLSEDNETAKEKLQSSSPTQKEGGEKDILNDSLTDIQCEDILDQLSESPEKTFDDKDIVNIWLD